MQYQDKNCGMMEEEVVYGKERNDAQRERMEDYGGALGQRRSADVLGDYKQACRPCGYDAQNGAGTDEPIMPETAFELCGG